ncbi:CsbD family protein [Dyella agri]|uniref:CsbD family protein n=1 Tax=Dyella agri TaxID=1926869 RepID=A0ABW8KM75_9GAMM
MNEDKIKGQWKQLHGKLKARWGKLTDDDLMVTDGRVIPPLLALAKSGAKRARPISAWV